MVWFTTLVYSFVYGWKETLLFNFISINPYRNCQKWIRNLLSLLEVPKDGKPKYTQTFSKKNCSSCCTNEMKFILMCLKDWIDQGDMDIWQLFAGKKRGIQEAPLKGDKKECKLTWNDISHTSGLYQKGEPQKVNKC